MTWLTNMTITGRIKYIVAVVGNTAKGVTVRADEVQGTVYH
jgi:hypothetical protein